MIARRPLIATICVASMTVAMFASAVTDAAWEDDAAFIGTVTIADGSAGPSTPEAGVHGPLRPATGTALDDITWAMPPSSPNSSNTCVSFHATAATGGWSVTLERNEAPLWGGGSAWTSSPNVSQQTLPDSFVFSSTASSGSVEICMNSPLDPPVALDKYVTSVSDPVLSTTGAGACVDITITGVQNPATYPFFFGWKLDLDLAGMKAFLDANGIVFTDLQVTQQGTWFQTAISSDGATATLTSTATGSISGTQQRVLTACANGWRR